jgi:nicotinate-nucleotide adenylyltransferase
MLRCLLRGRSQFKISRIELQRRGISYTVDTLKAFKKRYPSTALVLIIGADNLVQFHSWKSPDTILRLALLAVYRRAGWTMPLKENTIHYIVLKGRIFRISSTEIRKKIESGASIGALVPQSVIRYIEQHSLYSNVTVIPRKR